MTQLMGGSPVREQESDAVARASVFAAEELATRLRRLPPAGDVWRVWREVGISDVAVQLGPPQDGEAPPAGSAYVAYTVLRQPRPVSRRPPDQEWQVVCHTARVTGGWVVDQVEVEPNLAALL